MYLAHHYLKNVNFICKRSLNSFIKASLIFEDGGPTEGINLQTKTLGTLRKTPRPRRSELSGTPTATGTPTLYTTTSADDSSRKRRSRRFHPKDDDDASNTE